MKSVMLVDDNPYDNEFHAIVLRRAGFNGEIKVCESGEEALSCFDADTPPCIDLMFLDVNLTGWSGFDIARRLMDLPDQNPDMIIVMLTSSPDPEDVTTAGSIPIVRDLVTKPLSAKSVDELLAKYWPSNES